MLTRATCAATYEQARRNYLPGLPDLPVPFQPAFIYRYSRAADCRT
jgi:hypothetical protein